MFEPSPRPRLETEAQQAIALAMSEGELLANVVDAASKLHWRVIHFRDSRREVKPGVFVGDDLAEDWPDCTFVSVTPGRRTFYRELKGYQGRRARIMGRLTEGQRHLMGLMAAAGDDVDLWTPEHWVSGEIERRLR